MKDQECFDVDGSSSPWIPSGYDPVLVLNDASKKFSRQPELTSPRFQPTYDLDFDEEERDKELTWIIRHEQSLIDQIIHGQLAGQYWLITSQIMGFIFSNSIKILMVTLIC